MKNLSILLVLLVCVSCEEKPQAGDFNDRVLDFAIENGEYKFIELPDLYSKTMAMSDEKSEQFLLAEKLKAKGFEVKKQTIGSASVSGIKVVTIILSKEFCECEVSKTYYPTPYESEYIVTEKVRCSDVSR